MGVVVVAMILGSAVLCFKHHRRTSELSEHLLRGPDGSLNIPINLEGVPASLMPFQPEELARATQGWNEELLLGAGGFGKVYRVEHLPSLPYAGQCAVKRLDPDAMQGTAQLLTEIQVLGTCRHESLLPLLGFCVHAQSPSLVYPLMAGGSLDQRLMLSSEATSQPSLPWIQRLRILRDAARAVRYLHTAVASPTSSKDTILHRDIKPSNILLDEHLNAKLSDVGLARQAHELQEGNTHLSTSRVVGTHGYIDPLYTQTGRFNEVTDNCALLPQPPARARHRPPLTTSRRLRARLPSPVRSRTRHDDPGGTCRHARADRRVRVRGAARGTEQCAEPRRPRGAVAG